jgi:DNA-binding NtrC family response regulator
MTLIGVRAEICEIRKQAELAARSDTRLLLTGEGGTGKEFVARVIHQRSCRRNAPFVAVGCAALAKAQLEGELFGDSDGRGATTAAIEDADGGTIFLDSINELTLQLQARLMRFLDITAMPAIIARATRRIDARLMCSTRVPLMSAIRAGTFREDLYYRLNVMHLEVPRLHHRHSDIDVLLEHFSTQHAKRERPRAPELAQEWRTGFDAYAWENVRELVATAERLVTEGDQ